MKLYLAGPMRGYAEYNFPAFHAAAAKLREAGYTVFSPAEADMDEFGFDVSKEVPAGDDAALSRKLKMDPLAFRRNVFERDALEICRNADGIALLPGWEKSLGARAERALAEAIGLKVFIIEPLPDDAIALVDAKIGGR